MKTFFEMMRILEQDNETKNISQKPVQGPTEEPVQEPMQEPADDQLMEPEAGVDNTETASDLKHYMFFSNLKVMKNRIEEMLSMDAHQIDKMLEDGHDWAADHISTSKDDVEEVYNWISGMMK